MKDKDIFKFKAYWQIIEDNTGYDFSGYSFESLNRRLENFIFTESIGSAEELKEKVFSNKISEKFILDKLLVSYTEMFRDPEFFISLRKNVLPFLSTFSNISIWHAGCATGEEVYSLAILLEELNLLDRCDIYATDINEINLQNASRGIFPLSHMRESVSRYFRSGGKRNLSNYYTAFYENIIFNKRLRDKVHFTTHNLIDDKQVRRFHLILCRNVFIYFDYSLQQNVLKSICNSLYNYGYLGMGLKEHFVDISNTNLTKMDCENKIYRKIV